MGLATPWSGCGTTTGMVSNLRNPREVAMNTRLTPGSLVKAMRQISLTHGERMRHAEFSLMPNHSKKLSNTGVSPAIPRTIPFGVIIIDSFV